MHHIQGTTVGRPWRACMETISCTIMLNLPYIRCLSLGGLCARPVEILGFCHAYDHTSPMYTSPITLICQNFTAILWIKLKLKGPTAIFKFTLDIFFGIHGRSINIESYGE